MIRHPPRSTRTDTLFPYTTLFRSRTRASLSLESHLALPRAAARQHRRNGDGEEAQDHRPQRRRKRRAGSRRMTADIIIYHNPECGTSRNTLALIRNAGIEPHVVEYLKTPPSRPLIEQLLERSEERRVGKEGVSTCSTRWSPPQ